MSKSDESTFPKITKPIDTETSVYFDVDETLIQWHPVEATHVVDGVPVAVNKDVVKYMKQCWHEGLRICVWSQGGFIWAQKVGKAIGINLYVDHYLSKPNIYVDDIGHFMWMGTWAKVKDGKIVGEGFNE